MTRFEVRQLGGYLTLLQDGSMRVFSRILWRIDGKLNGWKTKLLSLAGGTVMAQAVLTTILKYPMQSTLLPISLCNTIDKNIQNFIWGSSQGNPKVHFDQLGGSD